MTKFLSGKTALVTGSSHGIGKAVAESLAENGAFVYLHCANNTVKANEVKTEIEAKGGKAEILLCDLSDTEKSAHLLEGKNIDILVLNASVQIKCNWDEIKTEDLYTQFNCNFVSSYMLIKQVFPYMKEKNWGRIITIGSVQEAKPHPQMLIYSASKAAQTNMVKSLALQLAQHNITVNNIAPGVICTDRNEEALSNPEYAKFVADSIPLGYFGQPDDISPAVKLLCSDAGNYITGQSIFIDGGKSIL